MNQPACKSTVPLAPSFYRLIRGNMFIVAIFRLLLLLKDRRFIVSKLRYRVYLLVIHFYWRFILRKL